MIVWPFPEGALGVGNGFVGIVGNGLLGNGLLGSELLDELPVPLSDTVIFPFG
jgi:hypothetical protein